MLEAREKRPQARCEPPLLLARPASTGGVPGGMGPVIKSVTGSCYDNSFIRSVLERIPLRFEHSLHGERSSCTLLPRNRPRSVRSGAIDAEWCARRPCAGQPLLC